MRPPHPIAFQIDHTPPPWGRGGVRYTPCRAGTCVKKERAGHLSGWGFTSGIGCVGGDCDGDCMGGGYPAYPPFNWISKRRNPPVTGFRELWTMSMMLKRKQD